MFLFGLKTHLYHHQVIIRILSIAISSSSWKAIQYHAICTTYNCNKIIRIHSYIPYEHAPMHKYYVRMRITTYYLIHAYAYVNT